MCWASPCLVFSLKIINNIAANQLSPNNFQTPHHHHHHCLWCIVLKCHQPPLKFIAYIFIFKCLWCAVFSNFMLPSQTFPPTVKPSHIGYCYISYVYKKIPLQALTGPEGSRRLRLPDFKTIGTWRWQGCQPYAPAISTSRKYYPI
jgi:hypothetical protein